MTKLIVEYKNGEILTLPDKKYKIDFFSNWCTITPKVNNNPVCSQYTIPIFEIHNIIRE